MTTVALVRPEQRPFCLSMGLTRQCPECGKQYTSKARFCRADGSQLIDIPKGLRSSTSGGGKDPLIGRVIAGRFLLEQFLGSGATGVVYRAMHKVLNRPMAVKLLKREFIWDERSLLRFLREARAASVMDHANIVYLYDFGRDELGEPYLVLEYVDGQTLHAAIQQSPTRTLPIERTLNIMLQVARALEHAHGKGVVHRDIKPENIVLTRLKDQDGWVKVLDFGVARIIGQAPVTGHGQVTGTAEFIAPETLLDDAVVAPPVDLYAVGIIFHDALVGRPPFTGQLDIVLHQHLYSVPPLLSERSGDTSLPIDLDLLVARLLEKDPAHRPTATQLVIELEQICQQLSNVDPAPPAVSLNDQATLKLTVYQRPTSIVPVQERKTSLVNRLDRPTQLIDRQGWPTQLLPQLVPEANTLPLHQRVSDDSALDYDRGTDLLFRKANSLATISWPGGWPLTLLNLRTHIADCDRVESELSEQLLAIEKHHREHQQVQERHQQLRQGILTLSERLQTDQSLSDEERQGLFVDLEELERSFFATEQRWRSLPSAAPEPLRHRLQEVRLDRQRARCLFARLAVEMSSPAALAADRNQVVELLETLDNPKKSWARS